MDTSDLQADQQICFRPDRWAHLVSPPQAGTVAMTMHPRHVIMRFLHTCRRIFHRRGWPVAWVVRALRGARWHPAKHSAERLDHLLRRAPVALDDHDISTFLCDRSVMVTGAGGSIGAELCRQMVRYGVKQLILIERCENALFCIHRELSQHVPDIELIPCVADVGDRNRMEHLFRDHTPTVIFHAAAHKHVPMMESNVIEAVKNNVLATCQLADLAEAFAVRHFVFISTDKAVNPSSVMGATKRAAELVLQSRAQQSPHIQWVMVRFGNVLGSNGSVVTIFKEQIAQGGPITITHPDMCRYFMTIPEACQLVLKAATLGRSGDIFTLDMGKPINILDLARMLARLSGLELHRDINVVFTGIRPGEKLFEELNLRSENVAPTAHPQIFVGRARSPACAERLLMLQQLHDHVICGDTQAVLHTLHKIIPEYGGDQRPVQTQRTPMTRVAQ